MDPVLRTLTLEWMNALLFHHPVKSGLDGILRAMGVVHLYGASGIHLYAVLSWIEIGGKRLGRFGGFSSRFIRILILALFLITIFSIWRLQGFTLSLFRPLTSILIRAALREFGFRVWIFLPLGLTFFLEWILCLKSGLSPGAHHYYLAVGGSLIALSNRSPLESAISLHLKLAVYSWVPIALIDLYRDHLVSPWTPILSLLTIPPLTLFLYPGTLFIILFTGQTPEFVILLWGGFLKALVTVLDFMPSVFSMGWMSLFPSIFALGFIKTPRRFFQARVGLCLGLVFSLFALSQAQSPNRVVQLQVGQGDSALIQADGHTEMIDVGPLSLPGPEGWIRSLSRYGVTSLDGVLLTHLDLDHAGGLHALLSIVQPKCIEVSQYHQYEKKGAELKSWLKRRPEFPKMQDSGCIQLSQVSWFRSLRSGTKGNLWMGGVVRRMNDSEAYFALGDGDASQELQFEKFFSTQIREAQVRVWKVGHHGSRFSSESEFIRRFNAHEFWISVGRKNPYHHPAVETLARIRMSKGRLRRTDLEGDLVYRAKGATRKINQ